MFKILNEFLAGILKKNGINAHNPFRNNFVLNRCKMFLVGKLCRSWKRLFGRFFSSLLFFSYHVWWLNQSWIRKSEI